MEACTLQDSSATAEPELRVFTEAASKARPDILAQDGADADVSFQSWWQTDAEAETQVAAHYAALPDVQVYSGASALACKDAAARQ